MMSSTSCISNRYFLGKGGKPTMFSNEVENLIVVSTTTRVHLYEQRRLVI